MTWKRTFLVSGFVGLWLVASATYGLNTLQPVQASGLYRGHALEAYIVTNDLALLRQGRPWQFDEKQRCNFTHFSPEAADVSANFLRRFREFKVPESYWARIKGGWGDVESYGVLRFL